MSCGLHDSLGFETLGRPAVLVFEAGQRPVRLACCRLSGVFRAGEPVPLPPAVLVRWPGLVRGTLRQTGHIMLLEPPVLQALVDDDPDAFQARFEPVP